MSYSKSGYSTSGEGYLHAPEEVAPPYLDAKQLAEFRETIQLARSEMQWVNEYERSILGIEDNSGGLCKLVDAKAAFSRFATCKPLARIPVAAVLRANNATHGFIMRIDPKGNAQSKMRINVDNSLNPRNNSMSVGRACMLNMGFIPSQNSETQLVWHRGDVKPLLPSSGWHDDLLLDYVGYPDERAKKDTPIRICTAIAMGDMVEPLLNDNGLQDLYTAWQHVNTPGMQSQINDIFQAELDAELK